MISSPSDAIEVLGGPKDVSDALKKPLTTVASWGARESIPVEFWPALIKVAAAKGVDGISYESLARAHAQPASSRTA